MASSPQPALAYPNGFLVSNELRLFTVTLQQRDNGGSTTLYQKKEVFMIREFFFNFAGWELKRAILEQLIFFRYPEVEKSIRPFGLNHVLLVMMLIRTVVEEKRVAAPLYISIRLTVLAEKETKEKFWEIWSWQSSDDLNSSDQTNIERKSILSPWDRPSLSYANTRLCHGKDFMAEKKKETHFSTVMDQSSTPRLR